MSWTPKNNYIVCITLFLCLFSQSGNAADQLRLKSPVDQVTLVELYTSHGCSSCPPADAWLRNFTQDKDLWTKVIPLAFHVDYWDYLGWKDQFSSSRYSDRQKAYRRSGAISAVYTPGFVIGGREWRSWFGKRTVNLLSDKSVGALEANITPGKQAMIRFMPTDNVSAHNIRAHLAVLGFGINSNIGGGENSGRNLTEDFVVLGDSSTPANSDLKWQLSWPAVNDVKVKRKAVVAWLSREGDPAPIQAVGGWFE
jgi:hypothetical protein